MLFLYSFLKCLSKKCGNLLDDHKTIKNVQNTNGFDAL